jgi:hypothetical protein
MRDATGRASGSNENRILFFSLFIFTRSYTDKKERERWSLKRVGGEGEMNRQSSLSLMDVTDLTTFPAAILKDNRIVSPSSSSSFASPQPNSSWRLFFDSTTFHFWSISCMATRFDRANQYLIGIYRQPH